MIQYKNLCLSCIFDHHIKDFKSNNKLCCQPKLLPVANKINKSRHKSSLNDRVFSFLLTFLVFVGFFHVSFDIGNGLSKLVS